MNLLSRLRDHRSAGGGVVEQRSTFLSETDQLAAVQLSIILLNKKNDRSEEMILPKFLLDYRHQISERKARGGDSIKDTSFKGLLRDETLFDEIYQSYTGFLKHCNMIDYQDIQMEQENINASNIMESPQIKSPSNPALIECRRAMIGYLQLVVNTRNEIALARIIDIPTRGINHTAFTQIRKLSAIKNMPMYQVVCSFARQVMLGGKGYQDDKHILKQHSQGLVDFVELMDKLQAVTEEMDKKGMAKVLKIMKTAFIRVQSPVFSTSVVTQTVEKMLSYYGDYKTCSKSNSDGILYLRDFLDYLSCTCDQEITSSTQLCGVLSTPLPTPSINKTIKSFATKFTTPELKTPTKASSLKTTIDEGSTPCTTRQTLPDTHQTLPDTHQSLPDNPQTLEPVDETPTPITPVIRVVRCPKTPMEDKPIEKQADQFKKTSEEKSAQEKSRGSKKSIVKTNKNAMPAIKLPAKRKVPQQEKSKVSKKLKLLPGQKTLANFFK